MFKAGAIRKVEVKNFVTYSHAELYPGPNLNMIIGPNGTGKSTIVAAIILGLGGNPKVVGRGTKISEYVKHNCDEATVNIFLQDNDERKFVKVTRIFNTSDHNLWKLNDKKVKLNEVLDNIKQFNIQVNNLCQFLPQDKVQDFAKLNKQDLLTETQKALCRFDLLEKREQLIRKQEQHKELLGLIQNCDKKLTAANDLNSRLEGRVECFNKKKKYQDYIEHIDRKVSWTMYEDGRSKLSEVKIDRNQAQEVFTKCKNALKSDEEKINEIKKRITTEQQKNSKTTTLIRNTESTVNTGLEKVQALKDSVRKLQDEMQTKLAEIDQWDQEIENAQSKLEDMKKLQQENQVKCHANEKQKETLTVEMNKFLSVQKNLQATKEELFQVKQDNTIKIRSLESESVKLENVKHSRLQYLQRLNQDAFKAVTWLRNNKQLFDNEIYEPMMLEINVLDPRQSKYVENVIPMRDRLAFTCINKNDMHKLIKHLRENQKLSVNVIHSSIEGNVSEFQPNIPIERLRKYGFYTYVNNIFTAPKPIMRYLCKTYQLHNMPIGDASTNECYEKLPNQIRHFFSDKYRYRISFSKYSGQKSSSQVEVYSDQGLSLSLDIVKLNKLKGEIQDLQKVVQNNNNQYQIIQNQVEKVDGKIRELRDKLDEIQQVRQHAQTIESHIKTTQKKIVEMREMRKSPDIIEMETKTKIKRVLKNMETIQISLKDSNRMLIELIKDSSITTLKIEVERKKLDIIENEIRDKRQTCKEAEETLNLIKDKYSEIMNQAKTMLMKAKSLSQGFTPADDGFNQFRPEYDSLSNDVQELNKKKDELETKIACLNIADDGEMREYKERQDEIKKLSEDMAKFNEDLNKLVNKMNRLQDEWLIPLKQVVSEINLRFAAAFEKMKCAGEVSIYIGDNERDFSKYGISIKVTYRNGEPLQELNSSVQSGGERAVATAAYMLSLQELTPVPFRCVDEINQGMDAYNERRIFELIVEVTCNDNSSQYFLITPKLVPRLTYSSNMTVHFVHNGPFVVPDRKWAVSKLCNPQKLLLA